MNFGVLPVRAIAFQSLFLLMAIALEALIFYRQLDELDFKTSVQYATSVNLFSTFVGWLVFFNVQKILPEDLRIQLISYFFFERLFPNAWFANMAPVLTLVGLTIFFGVIFLELQGLNLLDILLEKVKQDEETIIKNQVRGRFRRLNNQSILFKRSDRTYTVLVANACSFSAILLLLVFRWIEQAFQRLQ